MSEVSPAPLPLITTSLGFTATASTRSPFATETRWMFTGLSMIRVLPTVTTSLLGVGTPSFCGAGSCGAPHNMATLTIKQVTEPRPPGSGGLKRHNAALTYLPSVLPSNLVSTRFVPEMISIVKGASLLGGGGGAISRATSGAGLGRGRGSSSDAGAFTRVPVNKFASAVPGG